MTITNKEVICQMSVDNVNDLTATAPTTTLKKQRAFALIAISDEDGLQESKTIHPFLTAKPVPVGVFGWGAVRNGVADALGIPQTLAVEVWPMEMSCPTFDLTRAGKEYARIDSLQLTILEELAEDGQSESLQAEDPQAPRQKS